VAESSRELADVCGHDVALPTPLVCSMVPAFNGYIHSLDSDVYRLGHTTVAVIPLGPKLSYDPPIARPPILLRFLRNFMSPDSPVAPPVTSAWVIGTCSIFGRFESTPAVELNGAQR